MVSAGSPPRQIDGVPDSATRGLLRGPLNYCKFREKAQQLKLVKSQPPTADSAAQGRSFLPGTHLGVDYIRGPLREKGVVGWGGWVGGGDTLPRGGSLEKNCGTAPLQLQARGPAYFTTRYPYLDS